VSYFTSLFRGAGTVLEDVPLVDVAYTRKLGGQGAGELTGKLLLADSSGSVVRAQALLDATRPWVCSLWAEVDGQLRWGGPIVSRPYESGQGYVDIKAAEVGAYFARRTLPVNRTHVAVEQFLIQRTMYADAVALPGGDVGVLLGADSSGVVRDRTYVAAQRKSVEDASRELSNVINGFDYAWQAVYSGSVPRLLLAQGYPTLGGTQLVELQYPGDVLAYSFPEEGGALATMSWAIGKQDQVTNITPQAQATATTLLDAGYPLLEQSASYTDIATPAELQAHADADLAAQAGPVTTVQLQLSLADLYASGLNLGNVVRLQVSDLMRWPTGLDVQLRCIAITERPQAGTATVTVADRVLVGGRIPSSGSVAELLAGLDRRILNVETV
jgi:hypothetical protein